MSENSSFDVQIRLVVEEGLNCLPSFSKCITTPTGKPHCISYTTGIDFQVHCPWIYFQMFMHVHI